MEVKLEAVKRDQKGKGPARRARVAGKVPGVVYGLDAEPANIMVDSNDLWHVLHTDAGMNVLVDLKVDGDEVLAMPREVQRDIIKGTLLHIDFIRIDRKKPIHVNVPIHLVGESVGVKEGGVVEHHLWELAIEVLPLAVPESIDADLTPLGINEALHVSDLEVPEGVTILTDPEETVVSIVPPPVIELPEDEEAAAAEAIEGEIVEGEAGEEAAEGGEASEDGEGE